jgi:hypothetical protein
MFRLAVIGESVGEPNSLLPSIATEERLLRLMTYELLVADDWAAAER